MREMDIARKLLKKHGKVTAQAIKELRNETDMPIWMCADMLKRLWRDMELAQLLSENARLRELVADMWFWGYEGHMESESQEWQMKHIDKVNDRMHELGVEI